MLARCLLLAALLLIPASTRAQDAAGDALSRITPAMLKFVESRDIAGAVTVVGRADGIKHHAAVGFRDLGAKDPMAKDTLFRIASMTKPITAIGIMILADEGKLNPDDDVAKHLPECCSSSALLRRSFRRFVPTRPTKPI